MMVFRHNELLPGEEPGSLFVDDVHHWIGVYSELLAALEEVAGGSDGPPDLVRQRERFGGRLAFWRERLAQLDSVAGDSVQPNPDPFGTIEARWQVEPT